MATIKSKVIINVCIAIGIVAAIVVVNYADLKKLQKLQDEGATRAANAVLAKEASMGGLALYRIIADAEINQKFVDTEKEWAAKKAEVLKNVADVGKVADTPEERTLCASTVAGIQEVISIFEGKMLPALKTGNGLTANIRDLDEKIDKPVTSVEETMDKLVESLDKKMKTADGEFDTTIRHAIAKALVIGLIGILLQAGLAGWLVRQVLKPVNAMVVLLQDVAEGDGDLTKRLDTSSKDEIAEASSWFNQFMEKIQQIIGQVGQTSTQLASAATQLNATSEQIATGAEEVACQTNTVATASEEMAATSGDIAQTCHHAADSAQLASNAAETGAVVVRSTVNGMQEIAQRVEAAAKTVESLGTRSDQIGAIISTIEDIADQTNLLALNAAIEAARAGEQGRGFAVVADEVRALAERTTKATREIGDMIKTIQQETKAAVREMEEGVQEVKKGTVEAEKSGAALSEILSQVANVNAQMSQIATAAEEQTATTAEITSNIHQVSQVVQSTAKGAMDSAEAAASVNQLAMELHNLVGRFRT